MPPGVGGVVVKLIGTANLQAFPGFALRVGGASLGGPKGAACFDGRMIAGRSGGTSGGGGTVVWG